MYFERQIDTISFKESNYIESYSVSLSSNQNLEYLERKIDIDASFKKNEDELKIISSKLKNAEAVLEESITNVHFLRNIKRVKNLIAISILY